MDEDFICSSVGFRKIDTMKRHFSTLCQSTVKLNNTPPGTILDSGAIATLRKKARNTPQFLILLTLLMFYTWT